MNYKFNIAVDLLRDELDCYVPPDKLKEVGNNSPEFETVEEYKTYLLDNVSEYQEKIKTLEAKKGAGETKESPAPFFYLNEEYEKHAFLNHLTFNYYQIRKRLKYGDNI